MKVWLEGEELTVVATVPNNCDARTSRHSRSHTRVSLNSAGHLENPEKSILRRGQVGKQIANPRTLPMTAESKAGASPGFSLTFPGN